MTMSKEFIERITASNGSVFTGPGTNSYLIGKEDITLVDPGPKIDAHIKNLVNVVLTSLKRLSSPTSNTLNNKNMPNLNAQTITKNTRIFERR